MLILSFARKGQNFSSAKKGQNLVTDIFKEQEKKRADFNYVQIFMFHTPSIFASWKSKIRMD